MTLRLMTVFVLSVSLAVCLALNVAWNAAAQAQAPSGYQLPTQGAHDISAAPDHHTTRIFDAGPWLDMGGRAGDMQPAGYVTYTMYLPTVQKDFSLTGDADGDGLLNGWELYGYDADKDGVIDVDLPALGASAWHKDIFVEMDYMTRTTAAQGLPPNQAVLDSIVATFAAAPATNPDGIDGIKIHLELDDELPHDGNLQPVETEFAALKAAYFDPKRAAVYHYMIWGDRFINGIAYSGYSLSIPGTDFIVTLGTWNGGGTDYEKTGTFIHELGHNLGLRHGGNDDLCNKPNYLSVMNYLFQTEGVYRNGTKYHFDYQNFDLPALDENNLDETVGLKGGSLLTEYGTTYWCPDGTGREVWDVSAIDWNCDGDTSDTELKRDLNDDAITGPLTSSNDWTRVVYNGGGIIGSSLPPQALTEQSRLQMLAAPPMDELTYEQYLEMQQRRKGPAQP